MPDGENPAEAAADTATEAAATAKDAAETATEAVRHAEEEGEDIVEAISTATAGHVERIVTERLDPLTARIEAALAKIEGIATAPAAAVREQLPSVEQAPTSVESVVTAPKKKTLIQRLPRWA